MQEYQDQRIVDLLMGNRDSLEEQGKKDVSSGKVDRFKIGELPPKDSTLVINGLKYTVFSVTDGGTVVLRLIGKE
jgi:hypothetical protein